MVVLASRPGPRRSAHLHHQAFAKLIPREYPLGVSATLYATLHLRKAVELVIPNGVEHRLIVYLSERRAHWIGCGLTDAATAFLQGGVIAAGIYELLTVCVALLESAA